MMIQYFITGFFLKLITGLDDTIVHIPLIANMTRSKIGRMAFATGIFIAIIFALFVSVIFSGIIGSFKYYNLISATLILILAGSIYYDTFLEKPRKKIEAKLDSKKVKKEIEKSEISTKRFFKLIGIGFVAAFATVIDDIIAYSSIFLNGSSAQIIYGILGILTATSIELYVVVHFSKKIQKIKYKKQITVAGLAVLSMLISLKII